MNCTHRVDHNQSNEIIYQRNSLLKYEPPRLIQSHDVSDADYKKICRATMSHSLTSTLLYDTHLNLVDPYSDTCRPADVLDFLFPPMEHIDKYNHKYIVCVSRHPATKFDVHNLEKNLDRRLKASKALEIGLCNYRRTIYDECFDELVRQITIECSERGILLCRIRNMYRDMMKHYMNNYTSANAYAMRTLLLGEQIKTKLTDEINSIEYDIEQIRKQLINVEDHYENILKVQARFQSIHENGILTTIEIPFELQQLRITNKSLKQELEYALLRKLKIHPSERINKKNEEEIENVWYK